MAHDAGMTTYDIDARTLAPQPTAVAEATLAVADIGRWLPRTYGTIARALAAHGEVITGPPFARFHRLAHGRFEVEAGFSVGHAIDGVDDVRSSTLPGGPVATTVHVGPYEDMEPAYEALASWIDARGGTPAGDAWEIYLTDAEEQPDPATWRTEIIQLYHAGPT